MTKKEQEIRELAVSLGVDYRVIELICIKRKVSPKKAALIVERDLNKKREERFEF